MNMLVTEYLNWIPEITKQRLDVWNAHQLANRLLVGESFASELFSIALRVKGLIYSQRKRAGGIAFLEKSEQYFQQKGLKATDTAKNNYVEIDEEHVRYREKEAAIEALVAYLDGKKSVLEKGHHLCKQAYKVDSV